MEKPAEITTSVESLVRHAKEYAETRYDLLLLNIQEKSSSVVSSMTSALLMGFVGLFFLFFISMGAAWLIYQQTGSASAGFFSIAGFYLLLAIVIYVFRESWITTPISNFMIRKITVNEED